MPTPRDVELQARITALLYAARDAGFATVTIDMRADGSFQATFQTDRVRTPPLRAQPVWMTDDEQTTAELWGSLHQREKIALDALYDRRGEVVPYEGIKGASSNTQISLKAKGYIRIGEDSSWHLTKEGEQFVAHVRAISQHL